MSDGNQRRVMKAKKSWRAKLRDSKGLPRVGRIMGKMTRRWGTGTMVIPAPKEVDAIMNQVPRGKVITINEVRLRLATMHKTSIACPITTGIFAWIAAHAAEEAAAEGRRRITPYWRTLKSGGEINQKYPGGIPRGCRPKGTGLSGRANAISSRTLNDRSSPFAREGV